MKLLFLVIWLISVDVTPSLTRNAFAIDESWVCSVKKSCVECLRLSQCSWCPTDNKCFSMKLPIFNDFCTDSAIEHKDFGFSLEDNAICACSKSSEIELEQNCYPPGISEGVECSGRGECVCGRCVCDPTPDFEHPTKMILGEYCEFDNFSCDGPRCNEGPYSLAQSGSDDEDSPDDVDTEIEDETFTMQ
ncbi:integrin beta-like protein 1 [Galleria mellonella]|uniref:Integrin beta-like protein 1 n=1 Tax=Galleria mellonella TaxID=7137 RepID=A0A6J1WQW4_GALME|nr:integrin beta-like protein 1 [Galleria mellonella]XP_026757852.1 integrin beta-like protein 1 [Galleria mellonella]